MSQFFRASGENASSAANVCGAALARVSSCAPAIGAVLLAAPKRVIVHPRRKSNASRLVVIRPITRKSLDDLDEDNKRMRGLLESCIVVLLGTCLVIAALLLIAGLLRNQMIIPIDIFSFIPPPSNCATPSIDFHLVATNHWKQA